jgi:S-adenosylmethionine synthetase
MSFSLTPTTSTGRRRSAEAVAAGHPDKICDWIADAIVDAAAQRERRALVGVEVAVHRASVFVTGRIAGTGLTEADIERVVRARYAELDHCPDWPPDPADLRVVCDLDLGPLLDGEADFRELSDDQSITIGYAIDSPETGWLPPEHWLAWQIVRDLGALRRGAPDLRLGPDGKAAVLCLEEPGEPMRLEMATVSLQQAVGADEIETRRRVVEAVEASLARAPGVFSAEPDLGSSVLVNGAGNFECGGPHGDNGLSGKKLVVDAYGPRVPIGGGAMSGKDFFKVDRAGSIAARRLALAIVRGGGAPEATVELLWRPGDREAIVAAVSGPDGETIDSTPWSSGIDFTLLDSGTRWPSSVSGHLPGYTVDGHFGGEQPWENPLPSPEHVKKMRALYAKAASTSLLAI